MKVKDIDKRIEQLDTIILKLQLIFEKLEKHNYNDLTNITSPTYMKLVQDIDKIIPPREYK